VLVGAVFNIPLIANHCRYLGLSPCDEVVNRTLREAVQRLQRLARRWKMMREGTTGRTSMKKAMTV
jgi:hypothetical protein